MEPDNHRRSWGRIRAAAGLGSMRLHDMRHTCVSLLLDLGLPPHIVREIVGHSDIEVTIGHDVRKWPRQDVLNWPRWWGQFGTS
ncbi:phage integrase family protein [Actinomadura pelletieri DSM 43383]|uniref:Phage integrase family protein n=2 Tax=Actinomadura pelletieri TaxID=111805 RepID=A0A495Q9E2_9ACTN|nr:phage integrase family protein [Actinomadura pelletieri DSM 43383]